MTTPNDRFPTGSLTGSFSCQSNDWFPAPSPTGAGTGRTGSSRGSSDQEPHTTTHPSPPTRRETPMTENQPTIVGHTDRVTGRPATIYTPPEDLVRNVPRADNQPDVSAPWDDDLAGPPVLELTRDRAAIRDSDEADERAPWRPPADMGKVCACGCNDLPERVPASGASVAALDLDACMGRAWESRDIGGVQQIVREDVPALVAEVRRLTEEGNAYLDEIETCDRMDLLTRAESAEAEVVTLRAQVAAVEALATKFEGWPSGPSYAVTAKAIRAALATTGEGE